MMPTSVVKTVDKRKISFLSYSLTFIELIIILALGLDEDHKATLLLIFGAI
jgi:hypothetical protein